MCSSDCAGITICGNKLACCTALARYHATCVTTREHRMLTHMPPVFAQHTKGVRQWAAHARVRDFPQQHSQRPMSDFRVAFTVLCGPPPAMICRQQICFTCSA